MAFTQKPSQRMGKQPRHRREAQTRSESEDTKIDACADADAQRHPDGMEKQKVGNANMEGDSRTHIEKPVFSNHCKKSITICIPLSLT